MQTRIDWVNVGLYIGMIVVSTFFVIGIGTVIRWVFW